MIRELKWDSGFFGRKIGVISPVSDAKALKTLLAEARSEHYRYLSCRISALGIGTARLFERHGFYLTDLGIVFERAAEGIPAPERTVSEGTTKDVETVKNITRGLFRDGRFYSDPFFSEEEAARLYQAWAENSLRGFADKVFLIEDKGFITCRVSGASGDIPLIGVANGHHGIGIGTALVLNALRWFRSNGVRLVTVRTQAGNSRAIKFYGRLGFGLKGADLTMGKVLAP